MRTGYTNFITIAYKMRAIIMSFVICSCNEDGGFLVSVLRKIKLTKLFLQAFSLRQHTYIKHDHNLTINALT